jgi:hypothetical protein
VLKTTQECRQVIALASEGKAESYRAAQRKKAPDQVEDRAGGVALVAVVAAVAVLNR